MRTPGEIFGLSGKVALVAGGSRGIGRGIAEALAGAGADVIIASRHREQGEEVAAALRTSGRRATALALDLGNPDQVAQAVDEACRWAGRLDIVVGSGGTAITRAALDITPAEWDQVLNTNLRGAFFLSQAAARCMRANGGGRIIHVASILGLVGAKAVSLYVASKGGLVMLCKALALEWAGLGITVNAIAPGYVETAMNAGAFADVRFRDSVLARTPLRRLGLAADVQGVALLLASSAGDYITGQALVVDGGWTAQ